MDMMDSDDDIIELCSWPAKPPASTSRSRPAPPSTSKTRPAPHSTSRSTSSTSTLSSKPSKQTTIKQTMWVASSFDDFNDFGQSLSTSQQSSSASASGSKNSDTEHKGRKRPRENTSSSNRGKAGSRSGTSTEDEELWPDKYAPKNTTDLAVHKKKVAEFQGWLEDCFRNKHRQGSMSLLTGPAGSGKTATVQAVATEMAVEVQEWINPVATIGSFDWNDGGGDFTPSAYRGGGESQVTLFQDFLLRANKYPSLQIFQQDQLRRKLILVEDFPNAFYRDAGRLHTILRSFREKGHCPLVFIISDSGGGNSNERLLFPNDLQSELCMANISFNPVAQTSLTKVLNRIASLESSKSRKKFLAPCKATIDGLASASTGDIRAAINALQFACLRGASDTDAFQALTKTTTSKKRSAKSGQSTSSAASKSRLRKQISKTEARDTQLAAIGGRDTSLFLFRALGKVLYCKRGDPSDFTDLPQLPTHLSEHERDPLLVNPEEVLDKCHLSAEFFTAFLHQNYLEFYPNIEDLVPATAYLSDADYLTIDWATRQTLQEYSACVASRGLMFCNSARARHKAGGGSGLGWKPLHKPQWYATIRKMKENCLTARELFKGMCQNPVELQTQVLPYLYLINKPLRNQAQASFLPGITKLTSRYGGGRNYAERLDERDISSLAQDIVDDDPEVTDSAFPSGGPASSQGLVSGSQGDADVQAAAEEEEEVIIEDYDDDDNDIW